MISSPPERSGFTLIEMVVAISILILLMGMVFSLLTAILQGAADLRLNQSRTDRTVALYRYLQNQLSSPHPGVSLFTAGVTTGLLEDDKAFLYYGDVRQGKMIAISVQHQPNGLQYLRLQQGINLLDSSRDPGRELVDDLESFSWAFKDRSPGNWHQAWAPAPALLPAVLELKFKVAGDSLAHQFDFYFPNVQANLTATTPVNFP